MRRAPAMVLAVALLACGGCVGSVLTAHGDAAVVYRLSPPVEAAPDAPATRVQAALAIGQPRAPEALDTARIAVVRPGQRFDYYAGMRWAEPAPQMLQDLVARAVGEEGRFATTVASPSRVPTEYLLDLEVRRFEAEYAQDGAAPTVRVSVLATLMDRRSGTRVASFEAQGSVAASDDRRDAVIAAFQQASSEAVGAIVQRLREAAAGLR